MNWDKLGLFNNHLLYVNSAFLYYYGFYYYYFVLYFIFLPSTFSGMHVWFLLHKLALLPYVSVDHELKTGMKPDC